MLIFFHTPKFLKLSLETRWAKQSMRKFLLSIVHPKVTSRRELTITGRKGKAHHWRSRWRSDSKTSVRSIEGKAFSRRGNSLNTSRNLQTYSAAAKPLQSCLTLCDPHRRQPTRLPCPWDSPGKNTGVCCYFLLQCMKVKSESEVAQSCPTLSDPMDCSLPGSSVHGIFQARVPEWGAIAFSGYESQSPTDKCIIFMPGKLNDMVPWE